MKIALILVSLAALGGGAYYLIKAGKLVAEPTFGSGAPAKAQAPVLLHKPLNGAQMAEAVKIALRVPVMFV
jgi:hypothetical protein